MKKKTLILIPALLVSFTLLSQNLSSSIASGQSIYEINCQACHMANGQGIEGVFPPLVGTKILSDKNRLIQVTVNGFSGPLEVKGVSYNGMMNGYPLSDQEVADVLNYIRNSWGNKGDQIKPTDIQPALKAAKD
jgi:nitrite reductase (NO-forming)